MAVHMPDLLTTDEAAAYLRLSERKLYELVANAAVPCTKVTGKWLFPKAALDRWLAAGLVAPAALAPAPAPPIVVARREQGLVVAPGNPLALTDLASIAAVRARLALRPPGAGAQLLLVALA